MFNRWKQRGRWFQIDGDSHSSARLVISTLERYAARAGTWSPVDLPMRGRCRPDLQEPTHEVVASLQPRPTSPMPRGALFILRTYPTTHGGTVVLLQARVRNAIRIPKADRFLRRVLTDLAACSPVPIDRPEHVRV